MPELESVSSTAHSTLSATPTHSPTSPPSHPSAVDCAPAPLALSLNAFTYTPVGRAAPVLENVNIDISPGQRVLVTGPSGSGKSTLLKALAGLIVDDSDDHEFITPVAGATLMVQNPVHAFVAPAVGLDIAFGPENAGVDPALMPPIVEASRRAAHVFSDLERDPFEASGGQQQRISLAGILAVGAGALLLDEPLAMLDEATARTVQGEILDASRGRTLVLTDHHAEPWLAHVDRILHVEHGGQIRDIPVDAQSTTARSLAPAEPSPTPATDFDESPSEGAVGRPLLHIEPVMELEGRMLFAEPVEVSARAGELVVIVGESGVGKSTLLRHILEATREDPEPEAGRRKRSRAKYRAAWLPQNPEQLFVARTVREEVATGAAPGHDVDDALEMVGIAHLAAQNPFSLSGGEQRRTAFATALAAEREIVVLDEPTVGLDDESFTAVFALIERAREQGAAVLVATHDPRLISRASQVVRLTPHASRTDFFPASSTDGGNGGTAALAGKKDRPTASDILSAAPPIPPVPRRPRRILADALNPVTIMGIAAAAFVGGMFVRSLTIGVITAIIALLLIPLTYRTWARFAMRAVPIAVAALMLAWSVMLLSGHSWGDLGTWRLAGSEGLRIFSMVAPGAFFMEAIEPARLGQALAQKLRVPARFAATMISGLARMNHMFAKWREIMDTRRIRGIHQDSRLALFKGATFALLVDTLRGAEIQAFAMDARGFATAQHRTWVHESRFTRADLWGMALAIGLLAVPIVATVVL